jgi:hypothetical protein
MVRRAALLVMALASAAGPAGAQGAVGAGPLTSTLAEAEPETGVIRVGVLRIAPGLTIREAGHDDNVFDEAVDPKEDWMIAATPDIAVFARTQFAQISAYAGSDMQWYKTYTSENDIGYMGHGRVDFCSAASARSSAAALRAGARGPTARSTCAPTRRPTNCQAAWPTRCSPTARCSARRSSPPPITRMPLNPA